MKKQFEIIEQIYNATKHSEERIKILREEIEREYIKIRTALIDAYSHDSDILFLVQFHSYGITFYKVTKLKLHEVVLTWFESNKKIGIPKTYEDAIILLDTMSEPTNCEIRSYRTFGYFDDTKARWDRIDWITEEVMDKKFLFEISETDFIKAIDIVHKFYSDGN